jgi:hypothetical protein
MAVPTKFAGAKQWNCHIFFGKKHNLPSSHQQRPHAQVLPANGD